MFDDLYAVWPDGTTCSLEEKRDLAELLTWKSDDYSVERAVGYEGDGSPIFLVLSEHERQAEEQAWLAGG